ncbi:phosphate/phosphite/phosphonate ABC transporter substrate-binding protein [Psychromonas sp.]|uniref:phosphate/phosphite/phosphonate ABC transporter substrate-binding protein n=1 Tax=Psychromonas sp. TaxID=1884585 RepID=UPI0039E61173
MRKIPYLIALLFVSWQCMAEKSLSFAIVPQQSASTLAKLWTPIAERLSEQSGLDIHFVTAGDIPTFEKRLAAGEYDIAYMNPYHYVVFNKLTGYQSIAKERDKQIKGIMVVPKNSEISRLTDLQNSVLAFPAPAAFAATILTQADLAAQKVSFTPTYVSSHDSVYRSVAKGIFPAGGGVLRTFNNVAPQIREQLRILWTTKGYTPHAIAVHPRVTIEDTLKVQRALLNMEQDAAGKQLLKSININGFENGVDADWNDIRALQLQQLSKD